VAIKVTGNPVFTELQETFAAEAIVHASASRRTSLRGVNFCNEPSHRHGGANRLQLT
jgi:hypothetical protein